VPEQRRRRAVRDSVYYARVLINGHVVCRSQPCHLTLPSFTAPLHLHAAVALHRRPRLVSLELWQTGWVDTRVAAVPMPVPLAFTADSVPVESVEPFDDWVGFSATNAMLPGATQFTLPMAPASPTPHAITATRCVLLGGGGGGEAGAWGQGQGRGVLSCLATVCVPPAGVYAWRKMRMCVCMCLCKCKCMRGR
jgi:hypothetical protein